MSFKNPTKSSLLARNILLLGNLFHSLGIDTWKGFSPYIAANPSKKSQVKKSQEKKHDNASTVSASFGCVWLLYYV